jgi:hypothetical protein
MANFSPNLRMGNPTDEHPKEDAKREHFSSKYCLLHRTYSCNGVVINVRKRKVLDEEGYLFRSYDHVLKDRHRDRPRNLGPHAELLSSMYLTLSQDSHHAQML